MRLPEHLQPDLETARAYVARVGPPEKLQLLCGLTGAHHYGFPSADSDLDLKAIHFAPTRDVLGMARTDAAIDCTEVFGGVECDYTSNEAEVALRLLVSGNGNMLERLLTPYRVVDSAAANRLRALAPAFLSRRFAAHYLGFGRGVRREHDNGPPTAKALLYAYRVALTGVHLMRTGEVLADLTVLAPRYGFPEALELVEHKRAADEKDAVSADVDAFHRARWERLDAMLLEARDTSPLPEQAADPQALSDWLADERLALL